MSSLLVATAGAFLVFAALERTDDTNLQIGIPPLAVVLLFTIVPEGERLAAGAGCVVGAIAYAAYFVRARGQRVPMPDYERALGDANEIDGGGTDAASHDGVTTPSTPDGPYYKSGTPEAFRLSEPDTPGEPMRFHGYVFDQAGNALEGVPIEIWHANGNGDYDLVGHVCRGHQFTGPGGRYAFETVKPFGYGLPSWSMAGVVDYRSAHIHVKIRRPEGDTFTTQVWFADDPRRETDIAYHRFSKTNVVDLDRDEANARVLARFDFVI